MSRLYLMSTIVDRNQTRAVLANQEVYGAAPVLTVFGRGTAASEVLRCLGLEATEKAMLLSVVTEESWEKMSGMLKRRMQFGIPGTGIAYITPLSSVGGGRALSFLLGAQEFQREEETTLKNTRYELLIAVAAQGYTEPVMQAARDAGAGGGTVIHAKGTGQEGAEKFLGVSLAAERELVFLVVKTERKNAVMRAVMDKAGLHTKAKTVLFSLPVTEAVGLRAE